MDQASTLSRPPPLSSFIGDSFGDEAASHSAWEPDLRTWRQIQGELATPSRTTPLPTSTAAAGWHCCGCDSDQAVFVSDGVWECLACSGRDFYRPDRMHRRQTSSGTWLYIPASAQGPDADGTTSSSTSSSTSGATPAPRLSRRQRRALRTRAGPPPDSEGHFSETGERAESERFTDDPVVDPDRIDFGIPRRRGVARGLPLRRDPPQRDGNAPVLPQHQRGKLGGRATETARPRKPLSQGEEPEHLAYLGSAALKDSSPTPSWNSRMGPERHVKWRGGTPPSPPVWRYDRDDLRAFAKWTRKVRIWEVQIAPYMPKKEASLLLYNSLSGELEAELEHAPLERINSSEGIEYIISSLQAPMEQKAVFQKRRYLADFEQIGRYANESMRSYVNRYKRAERNLGAVGVEVSAMYDSDARGNRLLERAKLGANDQRLILVGSRYSLAFEDVSESMCMQFPDFTSSDRRSRWTACSPQGGRQARRLGT